MVEQHRLSSHHVPNSDDWKIETPRHAGRRVCRGGSCRSHASADDVGANHKIALRIDGTAWADHRLPPPRLLCHWMQIGDVLIAGKRVTDQYRILRSALSCHMSDRRSEMG